MENYVKELQSMINPLRNDPCPCGSGLKYKKCCLKKVPQSQNFDPESDGIRARAFKEMSQENFEEAIRLFQSCLEFSSERYQIFEAMAACHDGLENYSSAMEYYTKALENSPISSHRELHYRLGVAAGCAEQFDQALSAFNKCLEYHSSEAIKNNLLGILRIIDDIRNGKVDPSFFRVRVQLQRAFSDMEAENYEAAAARLEKLAAIDPENSTIFYNLGVAYTFLKKEEEALTQFQKSVDLNPNYAQAWYNLGQISLIKKRDVSYALHCFERATLARPDYTSAHHQLGIVFELLGDKARALSSWKATLELDPENKAAKENIRRLEAAQTEGASAQIN
jgi:tetratricopeptide (TPR) repeat protein